MSVNQAEKNPRPRYKPYPKYKDYGVEWPREIPAAWEANLITAMAVFAAANKGSDDHPRPKGIGCIARGPFSTSWKLYPNCPAHRARPDAGGTHEPRDLRAFV